jgi:hypothetical protein
VIAGLLVIATAQAQEPARIVKPSEDLEALAQGKPDPKDKKKSEKEKDKGKEKKQPELALDRPLLFPEQRLETLPRTMPRTPEMLGDQPPIRFPPPVVPVAGGGGAGTAPARQAPASSAPTMAALGRRTEFMSASNITMTSMAPPTAPPAPMSATSACIASTSVWKKPSSMAPLPSSFASP